MASRGRASSRAATCTAGPPTVPEIRKHEAGTLVYAVHKVKGQPLQRIFYELYRDRAAFDAHEEQPQTYALRGARFCIRLPAAALQHLQLRPRSGLPWLRKVEADRASSPARKLRLGLG